jgi:hypothetical protein
MFALFDFERDYVLPGYAGGLREIVCFGGEPAVAPQWLIGELKQRCEREPVELPEHRLCQASLLQWLTGPSESLRGSSSDIFRGLSGSGFC